ncbi:NUDIX hydrolase [Streptomyces sp. GSL17-111]|uniref:NUDIX hydrolase n=1 Tax=Streptomyces sp. GSL17-111 TaxID=3121596 RepID=UPI0030F3F543
MPVPEFIRELRDVVGQRLLSLVAVTAIVHDDTGRVLLGRRADTGLWSVIGGICEPGEQPAETAVREVLEETGVHCVAEHLVLVETREPMRYPNGDACQFLDITLRCRAVGGEARVNDDESLEVGWFAPDALPPLEDFALFRLKQAAGDGPAWFAPARPTMNGPGTPGAAR